MPELTFIHVNKKGPIKEKILQLFQPSYAWYYSSSWNVHDVYHAILFSNDQTWFCHDFVLERNYVMIHLDIFSAKLIWINDKCKIEVHRNLKWKKWIGIGLLLTARPRLKLLRCRFTSKVIHMIDVRRSQDRLIFITGIPILKKRGPNFFWSIMPYLLGCFDLSRKHYKSLYLSGSYGYEVTQGQIWCVSVTSNINVILRFVVVVPYPSALWTQGFVLPHRLRSITRSGKRRYNSCQFTYFDIKYRFWVLVGIKHQCRFVSRVV